MALLYAGLGVFLPSMEDASGLLLFVYGMTYFFSNFGPNSTTFILPSETFPPEVRSTLNGFSAAAGKCGAVVGSAVFKPVVDGLGTNVAFWGCTLCAVLGVFLTIFFIEDRRGRDMATGNTILGSFQEGGKVSQTNA